MAMREGAAGDAHTGVSQPRGRDPLISIKLDVSQPTAGCRLRHRCRVRGLLSSDGYTWPEYLPGNCWSKPLEPAVLASRHDFRRYCRLGVSLLAGLGRTSLLVGLDHGGIWPGELNLLPSPSHSRRRIHESARSHAAMDMPGPSMSVYGHYEESCQGPKRDAQAEFMRGSIAVLCQPTRGRVTSSVRGDLCLIATVKCRDPVGQREICCPRLSVVQPAVEGCHVARRARQYHCSCIVSPCCTGVAQLAVQHMRCKCQPRVNKAGVRQDKSRQAHSRRRDKLLLEHRVYWFYLLP